MRVVAIVILAAGFGCGGGLIAAAEDEVHPSPPFWAVTGVSADDVLHLRDVPSADSKSLAGIPSNARGLKNFGCRRGELPFDQWARMGERERRAANTKWCRIEFRGKQGWVAGRFLKEDPVTEH
ncbi:MAG TPA: hypothetical protein VKF35_01860 [Hyphomicrobiaceae bacterium]|nr:hypothetical protein [Hyphomicrobiaceae bacterium]